MSRQFESSQAELSAIDENDNLLKEMLTSPDELRNLHQRFAEDDADSSSNRAAVQELMDFRPPYDEEDMEEKGMSDRFNVNFGLAAALKNEAVGPFLDIYASPTRITRIALEEDVDLDQRHQWADIMSDEFTKMIRSWDVMMSNMLQLIDITVTHGVAIPWFEDKSTLDSQIGSLEDCKFDADAVAVPSKISAMTITRTMSLSQIYAKIEDHEDDVDYNGWNGPEVKRLMKQSKPKTNEFDNWNYEEAARMVKACRAGNPHALPMVELIWGVIRELDGTISVYATHRDGPLDTEGKKIKDKDETWVYRKKSAYDDANQMFTIFPFSVGNKNRIYTIRGFGYALFLPGQADNILRSKMMDSARHRSSEIYQPESSIETIEDIQFIDIGHAMIAPKGLKGVQQFNTQRLNDGIGFALESNANVMNRHSSGLAGNSLAQNPGARRNELQVTAELEQANKMQGFAIALFYGPYDKYMRELVRRAFNETQSDMGIAKMVNRMKASCIARGVPQDVLSKIDLEATQATRLSGAGSKGSRLVSFQQMGQLYPSMDPMGQEHFNFDFASEIRGSDSAERYFGMPGVRRGHIDMSLAQLENNDLAEGSIIEPVDGENKMVHLRDHVEELVAGLEEVNQGNVDLAEWTMRNIPLYRHCVDTLEQTSVHESMIPELNSIRQQIQQAGEVIDNGLRHINKLRDDQGDMSQGAQEGADQEGAQAQQEGATQEETSSEKDSDIKNAKMFAEAQAKIEVMRMMSKAKTDNMQAESMAKIISMDAQTAADIRRKEILARAST
tara:strand:+ start:2048 stop:4405 length:2358 start_codon:yes stop_codon:yes gene_type:complete